MVVMNQALRQENCNSLLGVLLFHFLKNHIDSSNVGTLIVIIITEAVVDTCKDV